MARKMRLAHITSGARGCSCLSVFLLLGSLKVDASSERLCERDKFVIRKFGRLSAVLGLRTPLMSVTRTSLMNHFERMWFHSWRQCLLFTRKGPRSWRGPLVFA